MPRSALTAGSERRVRAPGRLSVRCCKPRHAFPPVLGLCLPHRVWGPRRSMWVKRKVHRMLVLTRKSNQSIMIGDDVEVSVLAVTGEKVRIGIQAPQEIPVFRKEIYPEIHREDATLEQPAQTKEAGATVESTRAVPDSPGATG